jgi:hypothetical protein
MELPTFAASVDVVMVLAPDTPAVDADADVVQAPSVNNCMDWVASDMFTATCGV